MKQSPIISVVMITYGHEKYISEAINSIFNQITNFSFELIISNDASPDNTDVIIRELIKNKPKNISIKYPLQKINLGVIKNFNWALNQAEGKYIAICEGDDYWTDPFKLQTQLFFLDFHVDYSLCFHNAFVGNTYTENGNKRFNNLNKSREIKLKELINNWIIPTASIFFRRNILPMPEWVVQIYSGDLTLAIIAISKGKIFYINSVMSFYRQDINNNTSMTNVIRDNNVFVLNEHIKLYQLYLNDPLCKKKNVIKSKINLLKKEVKFQENKNIGYIRLFIKMPLFFIRKVIQKLSLSEK